MRRTAQAFRAGAPALGRRSALAFGLLAVLACLEVVVLHQYARTLDLGARQINLCGRQRMLTQRAALLATALADAQGVESRADLARKLRHLAAELAAVHRGLLAGDPGLGLPVPGPPELRAVYRDPPHRLERKLAAFLASLDAVTAAAENLDGRLDPRLRPVLDAAHGGELLATLDAAVAALEASTSERVARLRRLNALGFALTLCALLVTLLAVIRPLAASVRRHIAELHANEERLRQQAEQLRLTLDNAPLGTAILDLGWRLRGVNRALCRMLGREESELLGTPYRELVDPEEAEATVARLQAAAADGAGTMTFAQGYRRRDGSVCRGVVHCGFVHGSAGEPVMAIAQFEDHTERLQAEEQARFDRERLARVARLSTMGEMAAGIAHEVNQPLTAIAAYTQACRRMISADGTDRVQVVATLDKAAAQALRAGEVIRRLRSFVQGRESGAETVELNRVVEDAVRLARAEARIRDCRIEVALAPSLPVVFVDAVQIQQVILNLIHNGIEAQNGATDPEIEVATGRAGEDLEVVVKDFGEGMPAELADEIFKPFVTTKASGLGMGLSISRSIVISHGGRLWFSANPERGTSFHFTLPAADGG